MTSEACPCGSGLGYEECCAPLHRGAVAKSAEALMRSRYSAYARRLSAYVLSTWHPKTRPREIDLADAPEEWVKLEVRRHETSGKNKAIVEFVATFRLPNDRANHRLHEVSRFVKEGNKWLYVDGDHPTSVALR
jgi:SEC-C motif-containing protein